MNCDKCFREIDYYINNNGKEVINVYYRDFILREICRECAEKMNKSFKKIPSAKKIYARRKR